MKRLLMLATLCVAGVASAITANWTKASNFNANGEFDTSHGLTTNTSFSIGVVFAVADASSFTTDGNKALLAVTNSGNTSTGPSFILWQNGSIVGKANAVPYRNESYGNFTAPGGTKGSMGNITDFSARLNDGENTAAITVQMFMDSSNQRCATYQLWLNGEKIIEATHTNIGSSVYSFPNLAATENATDVYYMQGIASKTDIASLPEPTALALLALGVAGLALRRRVS